MTENKRLRNETNKNLKQTEFTRRISLVSMFGFSDLSPVHECETVETTTFNFHTTPVLYFRCYRENLFSK